MITKSERETIEFGRVFAQKLKPGDVIALSGDLGAGKTTFTKGIAQGLGVPDSEHVNSPSFVLVREYKGNINLYHCDLYRLDNISDIAELGISDYFSEDGVMVIEWAEKGSSLMPSEHMLIKIKYLGDTKRNFQIEANGQRYKKMLETLRAE